jgi:NAD(P)-dependent dehydrogenase (short-subunit alcohol dehydrogenase family)
VLDLLDKGAKVAVVDLRPALLQDVSRSASLKGRLWVYEGDVSNDESVDAVCTQIERDIAPAHVSVLVNNAGDELHCTGAGLCPCRRPALVVCG